MQKNTPETQRKRSTSKSSFGAGSPPKCYSPNKQGLEPEDFTSLCLGFSSLVIVAVFVNAMGQTQAAKDLFSKTIPWLLKKLIRMCPSQ